MKLPRADARLKILPLEDQESLWQLIRPDDSEQDAISMIELQTEVPRLHGFTVGRSALYEWRSWYGFQRRVDHARRRSDQAKIEAAKAGDLDTDAIARVGQMTFTTEMAEGQNLKGFIALERLRMEKMRVENQQEQLKLEKRRVSLLEKKAEFADLVKAKAENREGGVTAAEMAEIERKLKLM
jgi:hypothetical protein